MVPQDGHKSRTCTHGRSSPADARYLRRGDAIQIVVGNWIHNIMRQYCTPPVKKRRILYIGHTGALGGAELAMWRLIAQLDRSRFQPLSFVRGGKARRTSPGDGVEVPHFAAADNVTRASRHQTARSILRKASLLPLVLRHIWRIARLIRELKVDVVHTNSLKADVLGGSLRDSRESP